MVFKGQKIICFFLKLEFLHLVYSGDVESF